MSWSIRNYNVFLREARDEWDLTLPEARQLYREVRDWKSGSAYGADVDRYADYLNTEEGQSQVYESVLYDLDVVPEAEPGEAAELWEWDDDTWLEEGAEVELTAQTYSKDE